MIKADIVRRVSEALSKEGAPIKDKDALYIVDQTIEALKETILRDGRLEVRDFGVFQIKQRKGRIGRNPKDLRTYPIPMHNAITFKGGKRFKNITADPQDDDAGEDSLDD